VTLLYVRTAKTASSTMNAWIGVDAPVTFNQRFLTEPQNKNLIDQAIAKGHCLITTVRDPWTRAISCWQQSLRSAWIDHRTSFKDYLKIDFHKFDSLHTITHNVSLVEYLDPYMDKIDRFLKTEKLDVELPALAKEFGLKKDKVIGSYNKSKFMDDKALKDVYDEEARELVLKKYKDDFDAFNYSKTIDF